MKKVSFIPLFILLAFGAQSQSKTLTHFFVLDGDTIPWVFLGEAVVMDDLPYVNRYSKDYLRTQRRVQKVYPYAKAAGELMAGYNKEIEKLPTRKAQKAYLERAEDELKRKFEGDIRDMTVTEGLILIKLVDRETGDTSYGLIDELRGSFSAFCWQGVARLFGHNLKQQYQPYGDDVMVEDVVRRIESGELAVLTTKADAPTAQTRQGRRK